MGAARAESEDGEVGLFGGCAGYAAEDCGVDLGEEVGAGSCGAGDGYEGGFFGGGGSGEDWTCDAGAEGGAGDVGSWTWGGCVCWTEDLAWESHDCG